jgi:hypothetical protein
MACYQFAQRSFLFPARFRSWFHGRAALGCIRIPSIPSRLRPILLARSVLQRLLFWRRGRCRLWSGFLSRLGGLLWSRLWCGLGGRLGRLLGWSLCKCTGRSSPAGLACTPIAQHLTGCCGCFGAGLFILGHGRMVMVLVPTLSQLFGFRCCCYSFLNSPPP